jgi:hypothetical protein
VHVAVQSERLDVFISADLSLFVCLLSSAHSFDFAPVLYYFCLPFGSTSSCGRTAHSTETADKHVSLSFDWLLRLQEITGTIS